MGCRYRFKAGRHSAVLQNQHLDALLPGLYRLHGGSGPGFTFGGVVIDSDWLISVLLKAASFAFVATPFILHLSQHSHHRPALRGTAGRL